MKLPTRPPSLTELSETNTGEPDLSPFRRIIDLLPTDIGKDLENEYLHWDKLKHKPLPEEIIDHTEWWLLTKFRRSSSYRKLSFYARDGAHFVYWLPDPIQKMLHEIDQQASGQVETTNQVTNRSTRDRYLVSSLIEEAITSSQLEGASTTSKIARAMLRENRKPTDESERMIFNNYRAMEFVRDSVRKPLTIEMILELHSIVMNNTNDGEFAGGRFRRPDEDIGVYDDRDNTLLHTPPPAEELNERLKLFCEFANDTKKHGEFLHPVVRSIIIHFMIGYDHPFVDGNGRTARALYYWSMAKHGYWLMEFVSISTILKNAPAKYARAYLFTEYDSNDVTYFLDLNLRVILRAIKKLQTYLIKKASEIKRVETILGSSPLSKKLNHRQLALISHALRNQSHLYSFESHRNSHNVSYPTARSDLLELKEFGILEQQKIGNAYYFKAITNMVDYLEDINKDDY